MSGSFLDRVRGVKEREVVEALAARAGKAFEPAPHRPGFVQSLAAAPGMAVIAEIKRASPSVGVICADLDAPAQARRYAAGGAAAVSVLTEGEWFGGSVADLAAVSSAIATPTLRKDFILDPVQIDVAVEAGASAVLLIVAFVSPDRLAELLAHARHRGIEALVEIHDEVEAEVALGVGARVIGVNARNLRTLTVDRGAVLRIGPALARRAGDEVILVAESGIHEVEHVREAWRAGYRAVLVGESLVRDGDPEARVRQLGGAVG